MKKTLQVHINKLGNNNGKIPQHHVFRVPRGAALAGAYVQEDESPVQPERGKPRVTATVCLIYVDVDPTAEIQRRRVALVAGARGESPGAAVEVSCPMHYRTWCFMPDGRPVAVYESDGESIGVVDASSEVEK
jgi:hypothetical protein